MYTNGFKLMFKLDITNIRPISFKVVLTFTKHMKGYFYSWKYTFYRVPIYIPHPNSQIIL